MLGKYIRRSINENGKLELVFEVGKCEELNKEKQYEIKEYKEKRGLTANAAAWVMMNSLSEKLNIPVVEVYREYIKDLNICKQMILGKEEFKTFSKAWTMLGMGWLVEQLDITDNDEIMANFYYGSSTYSVKQMWRFLKNIVEDCKEQGIPTPEDKKIDKMIESWGV
jgi:hypothetical protein